MARLWWALLGPLLRTPFEGTILLWMLGGPQGGQWLLGAFRRTPRTGGLLVGYGLWWDLWSLEGHRVLLGTVGPRWIGLWWGLWTFEDQLVLLGTVGPKWLLPGCGVL